MSAKATNYKGLRALLGIGQSPAGQTRTKMVRYRSGECAKSVRGERAWGACYTGRLFAFTGRTNMLAPKAFLDALSDQASRLFSGDTAQPRSELESQFKALLQSGFSKLELVSREEFDSQMVVLARTRARLEALEAKVEEMEARLNPAAAE